MPAIQSLFDPKSSTRSPKLKISEVFVFYFSFIVPDGALGHSRWYIFAPQPPMHLRQLKIKPRQKAFPWNSDVEGTKEEMIMVEGHQNVFRDFTDVTDEE